MVHPVSHAHFDSQSTQLAATIGQIIVRVEMLTARVPW